MHNILRNFDRVSFWIGFLAATLLWWLLARLRPAFSRLWRHLREQAALSRLERSQGDEIRIGNDMLRKAQGWHLAAALFSLDEILIPPRLLAPAPLPYAFEPPPSDDITDWVLPYLPDDPELAAFYHAPMLEVSEALAGGANLAICGEPGAGKSVALAHLACQIVRKQPGTEKIPQTVPLLIHYGELDLPLKEGQKASDALLNASAKSIQAVQSRRLPAVFETLLKHDRILLLLDGLDELSPNQLTQAALYLKSLLEERPTLRIVTTVHPLQHGKLPALGFQIVPLAGWGKTQRALFISRWSDLWGRYVQDPAQGKSETDPLLLVGWLLYDSLRMNPLELTLKVWAAFAGDALGPGALASLEAYLRRMLVNQPAKNRQGLEQLAAQMTLAMEPITSRRNAEKWLAGAEVETTDTGGSVESQPEEVLSAQEKVRARGALPDLLNCGLIVERAGDQVSLSHPALAAFLASRRLAVQNAAAQIVAQPEWVGRSTTLGNISVLHDRSAWMEAMFTPEDQDPLQRDLVIAGRWLEKAPEGLAWPASLMRQLAVSLQKNRLPASLRARIFSALAQSNDPGVPVLFRQLLNDQQPVLRQLAALGLGYLRDVKSIEEISRRISDPNPGVSRAALLALVAIGEKTGLEAVAYTLLNAEEGLQKAAAEALANDPEEGYPTLQEASKLEHPAVRRAAVYGLAKIKLPWAVEILRELAAQDKQWVVQDAANQALQSLENLHPRTPQPLPALAQTPWLIAFAAERGMGISPGKPALEMLYRAIRDGNEDQRVAAIYWTGLSGDPNAILPIYQAFFASQGEVRETAFNALWNLAAAGTPLPPPAQYGLV